jgi:hypothetical protein
MPLKQLPSRRKLDGAYEGHALVGYRAVHMGDSSKFWRSIRLPSSQLRAEVIFSSEMSGFLRTTKRCKPQDRTLPHTQRF